MALSIGEYNMGFTPNAVDTNTTQTLSNKTIDTAATNTIKINGTSVTAVTGTGSVVLASSPFLAQSSTLAL
jgi:hypothetical protein